MNQVNNFIQSKKLINSIVVAILIIPLYVTSVFSIFSYINLRNPAEPNFDISEFDDFLSDGKVEEEIFEQDEYQEQSSVSDNIDLLPETGGYIKINSVTSKCLNGKIQATIKYSSDIKNSKFYINLDNPKKTFLGGTSIANISFETTKNNPSVYVNNGSIKSNTKTIALPKCPNPLPSKTEKKDDSPMIWTVEVLCEEPHIEMAIYNGASSKTGYTIKVTEMTKNNIYSIVVPGDNGYNREMVSFPKDFNTSIKELTGKYSIQVINNEKKARSATKVLSTTCSAKPTSTPKPTPTKAVIGKPVTSTMYCEIGGQLKVCKYKSYTNNEFVVDVQMAAKKTYSCSKVTSINVKIGLLPAKKVIKFFSCK